jgi:membrane fusion protein, copper/silver efflux system
MTRTLRVLAVSAVVLAAGIGGLWLGHHGVLTGFSAMGETPASSPAPSGPVIYYRDPDGKPLYSAEPAQTPDGRPYRPVPVSEDLNFDLPAKAAQSAAAPAGKKIRYYRNPMGLPDVSPTPKKDSMGMDYIAVYEGDDDDGAVKMTPGKVQRLGVKTETAALHVVSVPVRAPGTIQLDERRVAVISLRSEAFIDAVENVTTGTMVREGQPLVRLFSPQIAAAASDYATMLGFKGDKADAKQLHGARQRLLNLAAPPSLLTDIERTHEVPLTFTWTAPRSGIVLERNVVSGMRVMPGEVLFRIADHTAVWAMVDVAERDLGAVAAGQTVTVRARSYPDKVFTGKVALVYPHLMAATRTVRVRIELPNHDNLLLPDMYVDAVIETGGNAPVLAVPEDAVLDSGDRRLVIIDRGEGRFEPRPVEIGRRGAGYVEIRQGVAEGDVVVTAANFLIDAESNLRSALKTMTEGGAPQ